jgi:octaprenyl-diphosphate synthase
LAQERYEPGLHTTLEEMGTLLGQLFQRGDDLLDFNIRNDEGKTVLGDLKSGYLNSFGAFAFIGLDRTKLKQVQSMPDLYTLLGGESEFHKKVTEFDVKNKFLIQLYQHHLNSLKAYLKPTEHGLLKKLEPLTDVLYFRNTNSKK